MDAIKQSNRSLFIELAVTTSVLLVLARILFVVRDNGIMGPALSTIVAILFFYTPIVVLWLKKRPIDFLDKGGGRYLRSVFTFLVVVLIIFPPFLVAAHGWQLVVAKSNQFHAASFPNFLNVSIAQLLLVALPEEFYFRGYFQSTVDRIWSKRWKILGVSLGWGWIITAAVFALAHSVVFYQWWHFSIFFPALVFGYLRERTGSITSPVLFHAASNILMDWFLRSYV